MNGWIFIAGMLAGCACVVLSALTPAIADRIRHGKLPRREDDSS